MAKVPFRNLVFQGGGIKALAYHGALRVLEEQQILSQIERTAGTSAGAMLAALVSMGLSVDEIVEVYRSVDYREMLASQHTDFPERDSTPSRMVREFRNVQAQFRSISRLVGQFGWNSTRYARNWLHETIAQYCGGNGRATFADFRKRGFLDLHVVVTNVSARNTEFLCVDKTPDVAVADALLMTQAIPIFFEAIRFDGREIGQGDYYADGGILLNYPVHLFDSPEYAVNNRWFVNGVNWETLGFRLFTRPDCRENDEITSVLSYVQHVFEALREAQVELFEHSKTDHLRTISIDNCCVQTTALDVEPFDDNPSYQKLVTSGRTAATEFLTHYESPLIKPAYAAFLEWFWQGLNGRNRVR